jgi:hypothetical protein
MFRRTCGDLLACFLHLHARLRVQPNTRHSLRPLSSRVTLAIARTLLRRGNANAYGHGFVIPKMTVGLFDIQIRILAQDGARRHGPV